LKGNLIHVGVAEWKTAENPDALRTTLGSCVGVVLFSQQKKVGGMAHILLPEAPPGRIAHRGRYARQAIDSLVLDLKKMGVEPGELTARIFGGASMFESSPRTFLKNVGPENVKASIQILQTHRIPLTIEETGGHSGRTITVFFDDGRILLRTNGSEKFIYRI